MTLNPNVQKGSGDEEKEDARLGPKEQEQTPPEQAPEDEGPLERLSGLTRFDIPYWNGQEWRAALLDQILNEQTRSRQPSLIYNGGEVDPQTDRKKILTKEQADALYGSGSSSFDNATVSSFFPQGMVGSGFFVFKRQFKNDWSVDELTIHAETAPTQSGGVDFDVRVNGSVETRVNLPQGSNQAVATLSFGVSTDDRLEVVPGQASAPPDLADVTFTFSLS
jgi:hypothetical protein